MRSAASAIAILWALAGSGAPARADHAPAFVVPTMRGVPVVINGQDAAWAVVEGDWGLHRPGHGTRSVIHGHPVLMGPPPRGYYPATGRRPRLGRHEIERPSDRVPRPAQSYRRSWTSQSSRNPATVYPPYELPPVTIERRPRERYY